MSERIGGIEVRCDYNHTWTLELYGCTRVYAEQLAALLDGSSSLYTTHPRDHMGGQIARCQAENCGRPVRAQIFGFEL